LVLSIAFNHSHEFGVWKEVLRIEARFFPESHEMVYPQPAMELIPEVNPDSDPVLKVRYQTSFQSR
jgi:hypothetical protein